LCLKTLKINKYINKNILEAFDNVSRLEQGWPLKVTEMGWKTPKIKQKKAL
jgi:hypothetical protein